jgi:hypothetical protein
MHGAKVKNVKILINNFAMLLTRQFQQFVIVQLSSFPCCNLLRIEHLIITRGLSILNAVVYLMCGSRYID